LLLNIRRSHKISINKIRKLTKSTDVVDKAQNLKSRPKIHRWSLEKKGHQVQEEEVTRSQDGVITSLKFAWFMAKKSAKSRSLVQGI
jgi:hypothetical protein